MSKSKGNVIDPIDLIDRYGADALRFTLAAMAAQGRDIKLSEARVEGYRNFATKLWNASRFAEMNGCARVAGFDPAATREPLNRWILGEAPKAAAETAGRSNPTGSTTPPTPSIASSGACSATGISNSPSLSSRATRTRPPGRDAGDDRSRARHDLRASASVHAVPDRGTVGDQGRGGPAARRARWRWGPGRTQGLEVDEAIEAEIGWVVDLIGEIRSVKSEMGVPPSTAMSLILVSPSDAAQRRAPRWSESGQAARAGRVRRDGRAGAAGLGAARRAGRGRRPAACRRGRSRRGTGAARQGDRQGQGRDRQSRGEARKRRLPRARPGGRGGRARGAARDVRGTARQARRMRASACEGV